MPEEEKVYTSMYSRNAELYHHGIQGQKWGVTNGPPYPLDSDVSTGKRLKTKDEIRSEKLEKYKAKESNYDSKKQVSENKRFDKQIDSNMNKAQKAIDKGDSLKANKFKQRASDVAIQKALRDGYHYMNQQAIKELTYEDMIHEKKVAIGVGAAAVGANAAAGGLMFAMGVPFIPIMTVDIPEVVSDSRIRNYNKKHETN
ncbi:MAG: hypothetical protein J6Y02_12830 [Pseudobutyrivibrio sp.]|nr:hypothetical protein [Pseudobutyrivibrio sp.]